MRKLSVLVLALAMASPMMLGQQAAQAGDRLGDAELTKRVKAALIDDETTKARQINVETRNGVVQLSGFVDSEEMKEAALTRAKSVPGIAEVRNDLVVRESERTVERWNL
jgi:hyperosmotically inducible periplasmic protein